MYFFICFLIPFIRLFLILHSYVHSLIVFVCFIVFIYSFDLIYMHWFTLRLFSFFFLFFFRSLVRLQIFRSLFFPLSISLNVYFITFPSICLFVLGVSTYLLFVAVKWILLCAKSAKGCTLRFSLSCRRKAHASLHVAMKAVIKSHHRTTEHCGGWWWISVEYNVLMNVPGCSVFLLCILYR